MEQKGAHKRELLTLVRVISFFKQIRHHESTESLGFYFVNNLYNILPYRQCVLWCIRDKKIRIVSASGQVSVTENAPLTQFIKKFIRQSLKKKYLLSPDEIQAHVEENGYAQIQEIDLEDRQGFSESEVSEYISSHMFQIFLYDNNNVIGGVWLSRSAGLGAMEKALLEDISDAVAVRLQFFQRARNRVRHSLLNSKMKKALMVAFLVFCLWPVKFSVTAGAEVVPKYNTVITTPYDGLISEIHVEPNEAVDDGDLLFSLDKTELQNAYNLALQELRTAREKFSKTERQVFSDASRKSDIYVLREQIKLKQLEADYAKERLGLADIQANENGVILFSDKNDLLGKPVRVGDKVMVLATNKEMELLIRIPADNMIELDAEAPVKFFLNTEPLDSHAAMIHNISYQPSRDADGLLTYKARAAIANPEDIEKIGLTGTAKVYGGDTVMIINLLRRPFIALRNLLHL